MSGNSPLHAFIQPRMAKNKILLSVLGLFVACLAITAVMRGVSHEQPAAAEIAALSEAGQAAHGQRASHPLLPDIRFKNGAGAVQSLADFGGRVVLLNIWATWCAPCRKEMRSLDRLQQSLGSPDFEVLALSVDQDGIAAVERFYHDMDLTALRVYADPRNEATAALAVPGLPTTLLIDTQRREVWRIAGPVAWEKPEVIASMRRDIERQLKR
jgi:thiol-disulfide isomerase/thioredoxin